MLCLFAVTAAFAETVSVCPVAALRDDSSSIVYYLRHQASSVYSPELLVILQGSDCNSVENVKAIPRLRGAYPDCDMLTIEKYGVTKDLPYSDSPEREDCPPGYLDNDTPELRAADADRVVRALIARYGYRKIIVIGGSEGALVANMLAARADYVTATVLFGGGGRFFYDDVITTLRSMRWTPEETAKNIEGFGQFRDYILSHDPYPVSMSNHGYRWWRMMLSVDQQAYLEKIRSPVLLVQGGKDTSASPDKAKEMAAALKAEGKANVSFRLYPDYDHSLNLSVADASADVVLADIRDWLSSVVH